MQLFRLQWAWLPMLGFSYYSTACTCDAPLDIESATTTYRNSLSVDVTAELPVSDASTNPFGENDPYRLFQANVSTVFKTEDLLEEKSAIVVKVPSSPSSDCSIRVSVGTSYLLFGHVQRVVVNDAIRPVLIMDECSPHMLLDDVSDHQAEELKTASGRLFGLPENLAPGISPAPPLPPPLATPIGAPVFLRPPVAVPSGGTPVIIGPGPPPTHSPTRRPTYKPSPHPTKVPTPYPTKGPTAKPTLHPTEKPTSHPTAKPTYQPTARPTYHPTAEPTPHPTAKPTLHPTSKPTAHPVPAPTRKPTLHPTPHPTVKPQAAPQCYSNDDCGYYQVCKYEKCVHADDDDDAYGGLPDDHHGDMPCKYTVDCGYGAECIAGYCQSSTSHPPESCIHNSQCPGDGAICLGGMCHPEGYQYDVGKCYYDVDCDYGFVCSYGYCKKDEKYTSAAYGDRDYYKTCKSSYDCKRGEYCKRGVCLPRSSSLSSSKYQSSYGPSSTSSKYQSSDPYNRRTLHSYHSNTYHEHTQGYYHNHPYESGPVRPSKPGYVGDKNNGGGLDGTGEYVSPIVDPYQPSPTHADYSAKPAKEEYGGYGKNNEDYLPTRPSSQSYTPNRASMAGYLGGNSYNVDLDQPAKYVPPVSDHSSAEPPNGEVGGYPRDHKEETDPYNSHTPQGHDDYSIIGSSDGYAGASPKTPSHERGSYGQEMHHTSSHENPHNGGLDQPAKYDPPVGDQPIKQVFSGYSHHEDALPQVHEDYKTTGSSYSSSGASPPQESSHGGSYGQETHRPSAPYAAQYHDGYNHQSSQSISGQACSRDGDCGRHQGYCGAGICQLHGQCSTNADCYNPSNYLGPGVRGLAKWTCVEGSCTSHHCIVDDCAGHSPCEMSACDAYYESCVIDYCGSKCTPWFFNRIGEAVC